jgi:hypothetical protein
MLVREIVHSNIRKRVEIIVTGIVMREKVSRQPMTHSYLRAIDNIVIKIIIKVQRE